MRKQLGFICLALTGLTGLVISQDQVFDPSFGQSGTVRLEFAKAKFVPKATVDTQGRIVLSGETQNKVQTIARLLPNGQLDSSFGKSGKLELKQLGQVFVDAQNRVLVVQTKQILRFTINGTLDSSYGSKGVFSFPTGTSKTILPMQKVVFNSDGSIWAALLERPRVKSENSDDDDNTPQLIKITNQGRLDVGIGTKGFASNNNGYSNMRIDAIVTTPNNGLALVSSGNLNSPAGVTTYQPPIWIHRFNQKGQLEPKQTTEGFESLTCTNGGWVEFFAVRPDNSAVLINSNSGDCNYMYRIWSLDTTNQVEPNFARDLPEEGTEGEALVKSQNGILLLLDPKISSLQKAVLYKDGSLLFHGAGKNTIQMQKLSVTGAMDTAFGKKEIPKAFGLGYRLLESKDNKILLVGLEQGVWSVKQLTF